MVISAKEANSVNTELQVYVPKKCVDVMYEVDECMW